VDELSQLVAELGVQVREVDGVDLGLYVHGLGHGLEVFELVLLAIDAR